MREILFRGKRTDNGKWVEGDVLQTRYHSGHIEYQIMPQTPVSSAYPVLSETVGQYTGLSDKNGRKIFEGDIISLVKHNSLTYKVVYELCGFELVNNKFVLDIYKSEDIEVIGNIHDDPELLR